MIQLIISHIDLGSSQGSETCSECLGEISFTEKKVEILAKTLTRAANCSTTMEINIASTFTLKLKLISRCRGTPHCAVISRTDGMLRFTFDLKLALPLRVSLSCIRLNPKHFQPSNDPYHSCYRGTVNAIMNVMFEMMMNRLAELRRVCFCD